MTGTARRRATGSGATCSGFLVVAARNSCSRNDERKGDETKRKGRNHAQGLTPALKRRNTFGVKDRLSCAAWMLSFLPPNGRSSRKRDVMLKLMSPVSCFFKPLLLRELLVVGLHIKHNIVLHISSTLNCFENSVEMCPKVNTRT